MKKMMLMAVMMVMTISASAMSYSQAREEALFLSDKMAYELNLTMEQYEAVYEINLDYLLSISLKSDIRGIYWDRRDADLRYVLDVYQYARYKAANYFYRPVYWKNRSFIFRIYDRYATRSLFYHNRPTAYSHYRGGYNKRPISYYRDKPQAHLGSRLPIVNGAKRYDEYYKGGSKQRNTVGSSNGRFVNGSSNKAKSHFGNHK